MNRRERLMASVRGEAVDRPPVCFYELNGFTQTAESSDPFNVYSGPTWKPLLDLTRDRSDIIQLWTGPEVINEAEDPSAELTTNRTWIDEHGSRFTRTEIHAGNRTLTSLTRRDPDVDTVWTLEHLLKDEDDFRAWLALPERENQYRINPAPVLEMEKRIGEAGIVMLGAADPLCHVAPLFDMATYTIMGLTEPVLMRKALDRAERSILPLVQQISAILPGRLWRIVGAEYAGEPYLPPYLFREYVTAYDRQIVKAIQANGGYARIHSHGRLAGILGAIADTGCTGLDPVEPPHQGDMTLAEVRERVGEQMTLFGNIEISDIENLPSDQFKEKVATALNEGPGGRGFVLMPSASPYGREITPLCLRNYEIMVEMAEASYSGGSRSTLR